MKKIINALIIIGYIWLAIVGIYEFAIPLEIKEQIPIDTKMFIFSAGFTGALSSALLYMKSFTFKVRKDNTEAHVLIASEVSDMKHQTQKQEVLTLRMKENVESLIKNKEIETKEIQENNKLLKRSIELQELELESRLTNPLIDKDIAEKIKVVLANESDNL